LARGLVATILNDYQGLADSMFSALHWDAWLTIFTAALAIFTALLAYYTYRSFRLQRLDSEHRNREIAARVRTYSALFLNAAKFVGAYEVNTKAYLPISKDEEISDALEMNSNILLLGRGGIGKSHAAVEHIRRFARRHWYQRWCVLTPDRLNISRIRSARIPRRNYVVFFDDLHEFINSSDDYTVFDAIDAVRDAAKRIRVIATLRSTTPAIDTVAREPKYFTRFRTIALPDWTEFQGDKLASLTGISREHWDGTPLSLKQPSDAQYQIYLRLSEIEKTILTCSKTCDYYGLHYCDKRLLFEIVQKVRQGTAPGEFTAAISAIERVGFLKRADDAVQVYSPYLLFVKDLSSTLTYGALRESVMHTGFNKELFVVGRSNFQLRNYEEAKALLDEYVKREPEVAAGHYRLGLVHARFNEPEAAISLLKRAIAIEPRFYFLYKLAELYEKIGETELSKTALLSAHAAQSKDDAARLSALAELARLSDEPEVALDIITQCLDEDPTIRHGWAIKGQILLRLDNYEQAEAALNKAKALEADKFVYFGLGQVARWRHDWSKAAEYFQTAVDADRDFSIAYPLLGQALSSSHRKKEAAAAYQSAIELNPDLAAGYFGLGLIAKYNRNWPEAMKQFLLATTKDPNLAEAHSYLGTAYERLSQFENAFESHKKAIQINPQSKHFRYGYAQSLAKAGKIAEAEATYQVALRIDPNFTLAAERLEELAHAHHNA
jgi:tetratricopeptide (TPR) repeat protein